MDSLWIPRNITLLDGPCYEDLTHQFYKIFCPISKCLACIEEKTLQSKITKKKRKKMNIANFINGFTNIYAYIICEENESK